MLALPFSDKLIYHHNRERTSLGILIQCASPAGDVKKLKLVDRFDKLKVCLLFLEPVCCLL
jgi:hypothetical protein